MKNGVGFVDPYEAKLAAAKEKEPKEPSFASPALKKVTPSSKAEPGSSTSERDVRDGTFEMPKLRTTPAKAPESNANGGRRVTGANLGTLGTLGNPRGAFQSFRSRHRG